MKIFADLYSKGWTSLVVFGDSLSDNGNGSYILTNRTWPADPAYYKGHFSNGPVWVEYLQNFLNIPKIEDHAYGGATINNSKIAGGTGYNSTIPVPSTTDQVAQYLQSTHTSNAHKLFIVGGGNNDAFFLSPEMDPTQAAQAVASDLLGTVKELYKSGGRYFVVPTDYCLEKIPYVLQYAQSAASGFTTFRREFAMYINQHAKGVLPKNARVTVFESCHNLNLLLAHPKKYGYTNTTGACLNGVYAGEAPTRSLCSNPNEHIFWDVYHPTTKTHRFLALDAERQLKKNSH